MSSGIREFLKSRRENGYEEETCARMSEMAGFSLGGFGFFSARLGVGAYNRERKATILRQFVTEKDSLRIVGLRPPIGIRIGHDAAALTWGIPSLRINMGALRRPRRLHPFRLLGVWGIPP